MRKLLTVLFLAALVSSTSACMRHTYTTGTGAPVHRPANFAEWQGHFLFGLIGDYPVHIDRICPSGNATVKERISILNGLIAMFTGALYIPTTVEVFCAPPARAGATEEPGSRTNDDIVAGR